MSAAKVPEAQEAISPTAQAMPSAASLARVIATNLFAICDLRFEILQFLSEAVPGGAAFFICDLRFAMG